MKYFSHKKSRQSGFTLIEMIVSLGIFTVVAVVAIGALLKVMDANRKSINLKNATNSINFALESMSREMRVGTKYYCGTSAPVSSAYIATDCPDGISGTWTIAFTSSKKSTVNDPTTGKPCNLVFAYRYLPSTSQLQKAEQNPTDCNDSITVDDFQDVISSPIIIVSSRIEVDNSIDKQPYAFIFLKGYTGVKEKDKVDFSIQTSISQRIK
jgi:prepilin-type N-terminal cleavage/methylation domain-containing protein